MTESSQSDNPSQQLSLRHGQIFRSIGWALGLIFILLGKNLGVVQVAWPGYLAGASALGTCLLLWALAPYCPRWICLSSWLIFDTLALTVLVAATGFHQSPFFIWLLAPAAVAVLENVVWLVWLTAGLGLVCYLGIEAWAQSVGLVLVPWAEVFWRGINLFLLGAAGLDLASGWLHKLASWGTVREKQRYQVLLEGVSDGYYECDLEGRLTFCNTAFANILGLPNAQEATGVLCRDFSGPAHWETLREAFDRCRQTGQAADSVSVQVTQPSGQKRFLEMSVSQALDHEEQIVGFRGTARDVTERVVAAKALAASEARHRTLFELSSEGIMLLETNGRIIDCNRRMADILGLGRGEITGRFPWDFSPAQQEGGTFSKGAAQKLIGQALGGEVKLFEWTLDHADGTPIASEVVLKALELEDGQTVLFASVRDLSERQAIVAELARSRERFRKLYESASHDEQVLRGLLTATGDPVIIMDPNHNCLFINEAFTRVFGWTGSEVLGTAINFIPQAEQDSYRACMNTLEQTGQVVDFITSRLTKDGGTIPVSLTCSAIRDEKGALAETILILRDISLQLENEQAMRRLYEAQKELAQRDPLTGLLNHRQMQAALDHELSQATRQGHPLAVVMIDLDGFKSLNDTHGHLVGDEALKVVAKVLSRNSRAGDHVARWGGDEFMLILPGSDTGQAMAVCRRIIKDLAVQSLRLDGGREIQVGASFGLALFPLDAAVKERLLSQADQAMYRAKDEAGDYSLMPAANSALVVERGRGLPVLRELVAQVESLKTGARRRSRLAAQWSEALGRALGLADDTVAQLGQAAELRNVGKVGMPRRWLDAGAELDRTQQILLDRHPIYGMILARQLSQLGEDALQAIAHCGQRFQDNGGSDLSPARQIPLPGRIVAVGVAMAGLLADRQLAGGELAEEMRRLAGREIDPELTELVLAEYMDQTDTGIRPGHS